MDIIMQSSRRKQRSRILACLFALALPLAACERNSDTSGDMPTGQAARDGSLDASTMDALTSAQQPAMDVTAALADEQPAKPAATPAASASALAVEKK